jgi:ribosomal RNA methyltransferase Nop2
VELLLSHLWSDTAREEREGLDLQIAQQRIQDVMRVLGNFATEREEGKSREEYVKQLKRDLAFYYGYNKFMISQILRLFSPPEAIEFLESNETPRPVTIRCNTLKVRRRDLAQVKNKCEMQFLVFDGKKNSLSFRVV